MSLPSWGGSTSASLHLKSFKTFFSSPDFRKNAVWGLLAWMWYEWAAQYCKMTVILTLHIMYDSWDENSCKMTVIFFPSFFGHTQYTSMISCVFIYVYIIVKCPLIFFSGIFMVIYGDGVTALARPTHRGEIFLKSGSEKNLLISCNSIFRKCEFSSGAPRRWLDPERCTHNAELA